MNGLVLTSVADAAAALDHATQQLQAAEVGQVLAIAAMCDLYQVDEDVLFEGVEEWITGGAAGTPRIGEFLAGEIAALLGISVGVAGFRIADVLNLRHRHPRLWDLVVTGKVRFWQATDITQRCADAGLGLAASLWVDQKMATSLMLNPWSRVKNLALEWIIQADPELARERAERLAASRYVTVEQIREGHCDMYGRLDAVDSILFDQALDVVAESIDPAAGDKDVRRAAAVGVLARNVFGQAQLPQSIIPGEGSTATDSSGDSTDAVSNALTVAGVDPTGHVNTFRRDGEMGVPGVPSVPRSCAGIRPGFGRPQNRHRRRSRPRTTVRRPARRPAAGLQGNGPPDHRPRSHRTHGFVPNPRRHAPGGRGAQPVRRVSLRNQTVSVLRPGPHGPVRPPKRFRCWANETFQPGAAVEVHPPAEDPRGLATHPTRTGCFPVGITTRLPISGDITGIGSHPKTRTPHASALVAGRTTRRTRPARTFAAGARIAALKLGDVRVSRLGDAKRLDSGLTQRQLWAPHC